MMLAQISEGRRQQLEHERQALQQWLDMAETKIPEDQQRIDRMSDEADALLREGKDFEALKIQKELRHLVQIHQDNLEDLERNQRRVDEIDRILSEETL